MRPDSWTRTVEAIVVGILEERAFDRLPVLADALEDAGCTDQFFLDVLRGRVREIVREVPEPTLAWGPWMWNREITPADRVRRRREYLTPIAFAEDVLRKALEQNRLPADL